MRAFGETVFNGQRFADVCGSVNFSSIYGTRVHRKGGQMCAGDAEFSNPRTMGQVLSWELGINMNKKFSVAGAEWAQFVIWDDGLYEKVGDEWKNATHRMHETPVMKRYLDLSTELVFFGSCVKETEYFMVGDIVKGNNHRYGITSVNMLKGQIVSIGPNADARISILEMTPGLERFVGTTHSVSLYDNRHKNFIRLERGAENED